MGWVAKASQMPSRQGATLRALRLWRWQAGKIGWQLFKYTGPNTTGVIDVIQLTVGLDIELSISEGSILCSVVPCTDW